MSNGISAYSSQDIMAQDAMRRAQLFVEQNGKTQQTQQTQQVQSTGADESIMAQKSAGGNTSTDGKDDGHIGFWSAAGHALKGGWNFVKGLAGFDKNNNFSLGTLVKNVAIGAGIAAVCVLTAGTAVPAVIAGIGVATAGAGVAKSVYKAATAKTDGEVKDAFEDTGSNTLALGLSIVGAKGAMKQVPGVDASKYTGFKGSMKAAWDSQTVGFKQGWSGLKTGYQAYKAGGVQGVKTAATDAATNFGKTVATNYRNATKTATVAETQQQKVQKFDSKIDELKSQAENATGRQKAKLNRQVKQLEAEKANYQQNYTDINSAKSFKDAQTKISEVEVEIAKIQKKLDNTTNTVTKAKLTKQSKVLEQQLNTYKSVTQQKLSQARNIRSEIDKIDKLKKAGKGSKELTAKRKDLVAQEKALKFELPKKADHAKYSETATNSTKDVMKKQEAYNKAKAEVAETQKAYEKYEAGDTSAERLEAFRTFTDAKDAYSTAFNELQQAKIANNSNQAYVSATSGYDYFGTISAKTKAFANTFNNQYGVATFDKFAGKRVPFTQYTVPTVNVPKSWSIVAANEWVNPAVGGPSLEDMMYAEMGLTPEQIAAQKTQGVDPATAKQPQGATNGGPSLADYQRLEYMMKAYGIA